MKNPNGYGSCYRLPGNRRKPWAVRITIKKDGGIYKYKYLGYFETLEDGLIALAEFNRDPYDLDARKITFSELYELWREHRGPAPRSSLYITPYNSLSVLHDLQFSAIRPIQIIHAIDESGKNMASIHQMKAMLSVLYKFALDNDYCSKDYSQSIDISRFSYRKSAARPHSAFTDEEITSLWSLSGDRGVDICLVLIYTGCRIMELLELKKEDVDLDARMLHVAKSKTAAGVRSVPIAKKILPLVRGMYNSSPSPYLINGVRGAKFQYNNFKMYIWNPLLEKMHMTHSTHDCRHTMVSMLTAAKVDVRMIGRIVGHSSGNITVDVYTHFTDAQLLEAVDLL